VRVPDLLDVSEAPSRFEATREGQKPARVERVAVWRLERLEPSVE